MSAANFLAKAMLNYAKPTRILDKPIACQRLTDSQQSRIVL